MEKNLAEMTWPELTRARRALVVVDVVESVRLMQAHEADVIDRWRHFVNEVQTQVLPAHGGRLVKSLGDGMLLEFESVPPAVAAALEIQTRIAPYNAGRDAEAAMYLRIGAHVAEVVVDELDVYGAGVNLAARLATLAGPGEIIMSEDARGAIVPGLDADIEDLGECHLKHLDAPTRAFRIGAPSERPIVWSATAAGIADRVGIAVIPFSSRQPGRTHDVLGEALADDLIAELSRHPELHVVSRLSTTAFRNRAVSLEMVTRSLGTHYVVHGSYLVSGDTVRVSAQMVNARDNAVIWAQTLEGPAADVLAGRGHVLESMVQAVCHALVGAEVHRACTSPLPSLESYTILLGAVALMHRLAQPDFDRARAMLAHLIERHPRATAPRAWLGKWHVMRVAQGWSPDPPADAQEARKVVGLALELDPTHALALAIDGLICAYINKDLVTAGERYDAALHSNPSEGLAWLFQSAWHSYHSRGPSAVDCAMRAQRLSPLDPMKYYYDNFTSTAMLSADDYEGAIEYGLRSLRANRSHGPTLRILTIAQALSGRMDDARRTVAEMRRVEPLFTVQRFVDRYPGRDAAHTLKYVDALRAAGLPE
jgi:adenylate cyclase